MRNHTKKFIAAAALTLCALLGAAVPADAESDIVQARPIWCC